MTHGGKYGRSMGAQHRRAITAVVLGVLTVGFVSPLWWEYFTQSPAERDGHTLLGYYVPITAIFGVPGAALLVLGMLVLHRQSRKK